MFGPPTLKTNIIRRLKTFSQIKKEYDIGNDIYRSGRRKYFSEIAKQFNLEGVPISRPSTRLYVDNYENTEKDEDVFDPIWYSTDLINSQIYCKDKPDCGTYAYTPRDATLIKKTKLVFLDLTDSDAVQNIVITRGKKIKVYKLFHEIIAPLYNHIIEKYKDQFIDEDGEKYLCVDNPCKNSFSIQEIVSAYGGYFGFRNSSYQIDRFYTLELFQLIKDLNIEKEQKCIVLGAYHADVIRGDLDDNMIPSITPNTYFGSEFTIKYEYSINKNCIEFKGEVQPLNSEQKGGGKKNNNTKNNKNKNKKIKKRKNKKQKTKKLTNK
jgi:hypothetical protein